MGTKHNGHTHMCITLVFGNIAPYSSKPIKNDNQIFWRLYNIHRFNNPSFLFKTKAGLFVISVEFLALFIPACNLS